MMLGKGEIWQANNYIKLSGERVKNQRLVDSITNRLRMLNAELRKIKSHNDDQWNDREDVLAVIGRNEALNWPKRSFEIVFQTGVNRFATRAIRDSLSLQDLCEQHLRHETDVGLPNFRELNVCKNGNRYVCLLSSPQPGFFLHLLLRNPRTGTGNTLSSLPLVTLILI
jgi:hypothetical protein